MTSQKIQRLKEDINYLNHKMTILEATLFEYKLRLKELMERVDEAETKQ